MTARAKRLYRVVATYPDGRVWRRTYQELSAAKDRRARIKDSAEITGATVTIEPSDPVTWPNDGTS
jgi:hypothetical protein